MNEELQKKFNGIADNFLLLFEKKLLNDDQLYQYIQQTTENIDLRLKNIEDAIK